MMAITKYSFFSIIVFIFNLLISSAFATKAEFEAIKKIENTESATSAEAIVRPKVEYNAENLRDPFQGTTLEETNLGTEEPVLEINPGILSSLTVQGVIWGGRFPQAIINNKVVKVGDTIEGAAVTSIDKDGITVFFSGRQYNLLPPAAAATPYNKPGGKDEPR